MYRLNMCDGSAVRTAETKEQAFALAKDMLKPYTQAEDYVHVWPHASGGFIAYVCCDGEHTDIFCRIRDV